MSSKMQIIDAEIVPSETETAIPYLGDASFELRDAAKHAVAEMVGIRVPEARVPRGESLIDVGEEKLRGIRDEWSRLPLLATGLDWYDAKLLSENAKDSKVMVQGLRMNPADGGLIPPGMPAGKTLSYTGSGFDQTAWFVKPGTVRKGFSENMLAMPPALRAQWFDHNAKNSTRKDEVVVRVVSAGGRRAIRAVTSERHSLVTGDDRTVVAALRKLTVLKGAKVRVTRHGFGDATWMEVFWPAVDRQIRVGDSLAMGIRFRNSETKGGSLVVEPFLFDAVCYNLTTAYSELMDEGDFTLRHVGDLSKRLPAILDKAQKTIEPFVRMFGDAYKNPFPATLPTRGEILARVGKKMEMSDEVLKLAAGLWDADGDDSAGDTLAGLANSLTRASQKLPMSQADLVEKTAGKVIAQGWAALL